MVKARDEALQPMVDEFQQALTVSMLSTQNDTRSVVAETRRLAALFLHGP